MYLLQKQLRLEIVKDLQPHRRSNRQSSDKLMRRVLNTLIEEYLTNNDYQYSLSVFQPESGCSSHSMTHQEVIDCLKIGPGSELHECLRKKGYCQQDSGSCSRWIL